VTPAKITPDRQPQRVNSFPEGISVDSAVSGVSVKMLAAYAYKAYRIFRR
jgi:hypothetical protein